MMKQEEKIDLTLQAEKLHSGNWIVRPRNALGTCGFFPKAWRAINVGKRPKNEAQAIRLAGDSVWT